MAAIGYISGTKLVNLSIHANNGVLETVGELLPGGQGSPRLVPNLGDCCQLAKVTLADEGVTLTAGTTYWLVAGPDDINAPTFRGAWQVSNSGSWTQIEPPGPWIPRSGAWPAAKILGMRIRSLASPHQSKANPEAAGAAGNVEVLLQPATALILRTKNAILLVDIDPNVVHKNSSFLLAHSVRREKPFSCYLTPYS